MAFLGQVEKNGLAYKTNPIPQWKQIDTKHISGKNALIFFLLFSINKNLLPSKEKLRKWK
jgi:hypothetical protein